MQDNLSAAELDDRIAVLRDNIRQLIEQAAALSGAADEGLLSDRIARQSSSLEKLLARREAMGRP